MRLLVLYGSETGTAQDVAEQIWRKSKQYGFTGPVLAMDEYPISQLTEEAFVVFVVATTGDGDEPLNMRQTWKFLLRRNLPANSLHKLKFACLGLGDSSYAKFNYAAKKLNKRLLQLGATAIYSLGLCDDQHDYGLGAVAMPWMADFFSSLCTNFDGQLMPEKNVSPVFRYFLKVLDESENSIDVEKLCGQLYKPQHALTLRENRRTTTTDHFQDVRFISFERPNNANWQPGDVLQLRPCNSDEDVERFFKLVGEHKLDFSAETIVNLYTAYSDMPLPAAYSQPISMRLVVKNIWDLRSRPRQHAFELLAVNCTDELERDKLEEFSTIEGLDSVISYINRPKRYILEVLQDFPHATSKLNLLMLFELMPIIQQRSFSIASAIRTGKQNDENETTLDLLVAVVEYKTNMSTARLGLCSNWLKALPMGANVYGSIKAGTMNIPSDLSVPIIMVGPGTGFAPFRSIIQHRLYAGQDIDSIGQLVAFFGCRSETKDFHFKSDFEKWEQTGIMKVFVAFSRDQDEKIYVQHLIVKNAVMLKELIISRNAKILVAGSSNNMPKSVKEAFLQVLDDDEVYLEKMIKTKRYQEETWS